MEKMNLTTELYPVKRKWFFLPTLDFYIFSEFMVYSCILMLVFIVLFLLGDVFNDLSDFLDSKVPMARTIQYFILKLPGNIRFVLPISMLLSCMWTMAMFGKHMEVTAMRASGLSLMRCGCPIFIVGLFVTGLNFWFNEMLIPYTEREAVILKVAATKSKEESLSFQKMLTYRSPDKKRTWLFKYFDVDGKQNQATLKSFRSDGSLEWDIMADSSEFDSKKGWVFHNVTKTPYSTDGLMPKASSKLNEMTYTREEITETPTDILNAVKDEDELPIWVIWDVLRKTKNMAPRCRAIFESVLWYRLAYPWSCFLAVFLGIPLATKNERSGIMAAVISSIVIIVVYYVVSMGFLMLGKQGVLPPFVAGMLPTLGFIIFGWYNVVRNRI
ncbi:MAG: LptF/LptG family permease [Victivallaceae bacterium]|nr:LptF/LptG family permease [Victivallaceae bacterium]MDD4181238.1 LptF/LptG family permease [Victivallaceae bacterium]